MEPLLRPMDLTWLVAILSLLALAGAGADDCDHYELKQGAECTIQGPDKSSNANVTIWCPWDNTPIYVNAFINATRKVALNSTGIQFVIKIRSWGGPPRYLDELENALLSPDSEKELTLFAVGTTWLKHFVNSKVLLPLSSNVANWPVLSTKALVPLQVVYDSWSQAPDQADPTSSDLRKWFAVPIATDTGVLVYNKQAFQKAGLPQPPAKITDWNYLFNVSKKLDNALPNKRGFGIREDNEYSTRILIPYLLDTTGTGFIKQNAKTQKWECALQSDPNVITALKSFLSMWMEQKAAPVVPCEDPKKDLTFYDVQNGTGGVAMLILSPNQVAPDFSNTTVGFSALPKSFLGGVGLAINPRAKGSSRQDYAWQIITELAENYLDEIATNTFCPPPYYSPSKPLDPIWTKQGSVHLAASTGLNAGIDTLGKPPAGDQPYSFNLEKETVFRCFLDKVINQGVKVEDALGDLCNTVNKVIQDYCRLGDIGCEQSKIKKSSKTKPGLVAGLAVGAFLLAAIVAALVVFFILLKRKGKKSRALARRPLHIDGSKSISRKELTIATNNFSDENLLGKGGFGTVYKGVLPNGKQVAVKQLLSNTEGGEAEFINEIEIISKIHHRNLVSVEGYCLEGGNMLLVTCLMPNGSLEDALFKTKLELTWANTYTILMGTANGINYLHTGCDQRIIHRDIKPANILLDEQLVARVADFGMAKNTDLQNTHVSTRIMGTLGYLDPYYSVSGQLTEKSDVYSFGVVMLVTLLGRRPYDLEAVNSEKQGTQVPMVEWVRFVGERALEKVLPRYAVVVEEEARRCLSVTILCLQNLPEARPTMGQALQMLTGDLVIPRLPVKEYIDDSYIPDYTGSSGSNSHITSTGFSNASTSVAAFTPPHYAMSLIKEGR